MSRLISIPPLVGPPHCSPLEVAEQGADQLADAALVGRHHALQAHHQVPAVLGVEHHQLVLPGGNAHSRHLGRRQRESDKEGGRRCTIKNKQTNKQEQRATETGAKETRMCAEWISTSPRTGS